jgi:hypothetical protein
VRALPVLGIVIVTGWPLVNFITREQGEAAAAGFLGKLRTAQEAFRQAGGGYTSELASLTSPCPGQPSAPLQTGDVVRLAAAGYDVTIRPAAASAASSGVDCHGRSTVSDYYAAVQPRSPGILAQQAFGTTASAGRIFVFFDGVAPLESDMGPGGLATPLEALDSFKIP